MVKRLFIAMGLLLLAASIILLIWQPDTLKTQLLNTMAKDVSHATPFELTIGRVSGNIITGFTLHEVHLVTKADRSELLGAKTIRLGVSWTALRRRLLRIDRMEWVEPTVRVSLDKKGHFVPVFKAQASEGEPFRYSIRRLTITKGRIIFVNHSVSPSQELVVRDIEMEAKVSSRQLDIDRLRWNLEDGDGALHGQMKLTPQWSGDFTLSDHELPVDKLLRVAGAAASAPSLVHSGDWTVHADSHTVTLAMTGRLAKEPISLDGVWTPAGLRRAKLEWSKPGLGSASVQVVDGQGKFQIALSSANFKAELQGDADWPRRVVRGHGTLSQIVRGSVAAERVEFAFSVNAHEQRLSVDTAVIQFGPDPKPFDIESGHLTLQGFTPRWASSASLKFRNGSSAEFSGTLSRAEAVWRLGWERLSMSLPSAGTWAANRPGFLSRAGGGRVEIHDLSLANGSQSLQISRAVMAGESSSMDLEAHELDPGPLFKFFGPEVALKGGGINASLRLSGPAERLSVDGSLTGKFESLEIPSVGLSVKNIELDARGAGRRIEIRRFSGKTKKGEITVTGGAEWPSLDYSLRAHGLILHGNPVLKGTADVDVHLAGSLDAPVVTGTIAIQEAVYTTPKDKDKKKPAPGAPVLPNAETSDSAWKRSTVDIAAQWPRNVWYREGVTNIETQGDLRIQKAKEKESLVLSGTIRSIRGNYNYFGRDFNIESGEIQFGGTPDFNPLLNIEASYRSDPTVVYLDITGNFDKPTLKLRSNPPLPEQDIISVIVFGQPLNELRSRSGSQNTNQEMMQAAGGVLGSYVTKELRQTGIAQLNVDLLNLQTTPQGSQLTVGRYLTRRLFISYGQAVRGSAEKSVTADYFLTDKWTLQGASDSSQGNHMDILFRYPLTHSDTATYASPVTVSPFRNSLDQTNFQQPGYGR